MLTLKDKGMAVDRIKRIEHKLDKVAEFLEDSFLTKEEEGILEEIRDIVEKGELHKLKRIA